MLLATLAAVALALLPQAPAGKAPVVLRPDARAEIAAALDVAKAANRRVLLFWTAEWSGKASKLGDLCAQREALRDELALEFDVVHVDVGSKKLELGVELAPRYGIELSIEKVPWFTVLDAEGSVVANQDPTEFKDPDSHQYAAARVFEFLKGHEAPRRASADLFAAAKQRAGREGKLVLAVCGARGGSSSILESWLTARDVRPILVKDFVFFDIDLVRTADGLELARQIATKPGGACSLPWSGMLSPDGTVLWRLTAREPWELRTIPDAIARFAGHISPEELAFLRTSLMVRQFGVGNCTMPGANPPEVARR